MAGALFLCAIIILACLLFNKISNRFGVPMLLAFILLGMFFGSDGIVKIPFENYEFAEKICSVALIFIMFYGGFGTKWNAAKPVALKAALLSSVGVVMTAGLTGGFCYFILKIGLLESFLIGAVISSTDAASVFSILRSKKLNLKYNTASMLELESGSNDPCSYMLTVIVLSVMNGTAGDTGHVVYMIFAQLVYGLAIGAAIAFAALFILRRVKFATNGFDTIFVVAVAVFAYALPSLAGGNGYLSAYIVGIILGNQKIHNKKSLVNFFDGLTGLMQMLIFFLLGLLAFPSQLPKIFLPALAIALFLTFVARPVSIFAILTPFKCKLNQQLLVSWSGLRGAASIVFAIMATISGANTSNDVFSIVFCIVLLSIMIQGTLIPLVSRKLNMVDAAADVMRTFTDFSEEEEMQFIKLSVTPGHSWIGQCIRDIALAPNTLIVMILREGSPLMPKGNTPVCEDDVVVMGAPAFDDHVALEIRMTTLGAGNQQIGKRISELSYTPQELILMVKRDGKCIIPSGTTLLLENDILMISEIA